MVRTLAALIPLFPLLSAIILLVLGARVTRCRSHLVAQVAIGLSAICSLALLVLVGQSPHPDTLHLYNWIEIPGSVPLSIPIALGVDSLSATMLAMLTFVATLVAVYSAGYMHGDRGYWRFFTEVSLFVFSMIMLVLSTNFIQLFMFWEAVGLCSYLLIGFWYEKPAAAAAGKKAFLVNRIGDIGFATGIFLIWRTFGSLNFTDVFVASKIAEVPTETMTLICLCLFAGACGKSAQFPLHVWLPDAMEGPTPVSALIHAATMVTAGVYMVARCTPLFMAAPDAQIVVACVGGFTALLTALIALTQTDLKRVLAYSTVSQLGYMFLGLGTGLMMGVSGAMLHLVTHAFFKALLFLGAGSVMHAMGGVIDMREFSGLRKKMPQTYVTFLVGSLALAGIFPLSGFWSKDTVLSAVWAAGNPAAHAEAHHDVTTTPHAADGAHGAAAEAVHSAALATQPVGHGLLGLERETVFQLLFWMGAFTALLTAFYTFRAVFMTFFGPEKIPHEAGHHAHESPPVMTIPLWILSIGAIFLGGALGHVTGIFDRYLDLTLPGVAVHHATDWFVIIISTAAAVAGILFAFVMYGLPSTLPARVAAAFGPLTRWSQHRFYLDEIYSVLFVMPLRASASVSRFLDWILVDGLVNAIGRLPGFLTQVFARPIQNGLVQFYALSMMLAMAVLLLALIVKPWP